MYSFKDSAGRAWVMDFTYATILRVQGLTNINLRTLVDGDEKNPLQPVFEFVSEPMSFGPALCAILKPQMETLGVKDEQFLETLDGDAAFNAGQAFVRSYVDFFHQSKKAALHDLINKSAELTTMGMEIAQKKMGMIDTEILKKKLEDDIDAHLAKLLNPSSGSAPASSESIPVLSPSVS